MKKIPEGSWATQISQFETNATRSGFEGQIRGFNLAPRVPVLSSDGNNGPFWKDQNIRMNIISYYN